MKNFNKIMTFAIIFFTLVNVQASSNKDKLVNSMFKKQKTNEVKIVELWQKNERGESLNDLVAEYVSQEIRLESMTDKKRNSLLSAVNKSGEKFTSTEGLIKALVMEYYSRQGIQLDDKFYVEGTYHIRVKEAAVK
ncbi:hypothetical protein PQO03_01470 [Lentisphaera profundi]|uniref:SurA N-terminal domain-containing protein n=1 Tax=Lentisphaera profundi TaxID=1658616 RepID=A0ABY7VR18_9BACT|nr:hypothetical protein [Lentisphaera profundi]WDE96636.1 hypothetical protein PQO03_01470 [Lentisphaera profundi]